MAPPGAAISVVYLKRSRHRGEGYLVCYEERSVFVRQVTSGPRRVASREEGELCASVYPGGCVGDGPGG